uniref:Repulsive guidance molecule BMP co-receptor a n=2 Tax=Callorhinchus milii TaxID=7868 RepID=A0A4W3IRX8_CALMI|eukprot:gi/632979563/ref/XP_007906540.1/ PREDICTED: repulsive guidance molecule A [Callorhinchus milii]
MGMGRGGERAALVRLLLGTMLCLPTVSSSKCSILRCNSEFLGATSGLQGAEESGQFCTALQTFAHCTRLTSRTCRGNLVYHSAVHGVEDLMSQHNCSRVGVGDTPRIPPTSQDSQNRSDPPGTCQFGGSQAHVPRLLHCSLFGDPHIRTFGDDLQTCSVRGAWPLIDNNYLFVQVTNVAVAEGSSATAPSQFTVIFKSFPGCAVEKVYQAQSDNLPAAFVDGSRTGGEGPGTSSLQVWERVRGQHVEILATYIGTTIVVRQVGRYLMFAVFMPEDIMNSFEERQGLQLCLRGCPADQRMDWVVPEPPRGQDGPAPGTFTQQTAGAKCKEKLAVEDLYFKSCLFDLLSTGDTNFTQAALYALEDARRLLVNKESVHVYEQFQRPTPANTAPPLLAPTLPLTHLFLICLCCCGYL